jgi:SNF2 family DNA or RNA helicase
MVDDDGDIVDFECDCPAFLENSGGCKHIVATMLKLYHKNDSRQISFVTNLDLLRQNRSQSPIQNYQLEDLISIFENKITESVKSEFNEGSVSLKPIIFISDRESINIEFTIGDTRQYVVKDAYTLANHIKNSTPNKYGKSLDFNHEIAKFEKKSQAIATFLRDEAESYRQIIAKTQGTFHSFNISGRYFKILPFSIDGFFDLFENQTLECNGYNYKYDNITFINSDPEVEFYIKKEDQKYYFTTDLFITFISFSKDYTYIIAKDNLYRCSKDFANIVLPAVNKIMMQPSKSIKLSDDYMGKFCSAVIPQISRYAKVTSEFEIPDNYKVQPLSTTIYLDTNSQGFIYANVVFNYGDIEINPLRKATADNSIARNLVEEAKIEATIENAGFRKTSVKYSMTDENNIYEFLTGGINILTKLGEVNVSDDFKKINIRYPKSISMGVRLKSNLIEIDIDKLEFDPAELKDILNTYKRRKKYFRLKDGSFLNLDNDYFGTMEKLVEDLNISSDEFESGHIQIPKYRSLYLDSLIKNNRWVDTQKEQSFKDMIRNIKESDETNFEIPDKLKGIMRNYQKTGYKWLNTLSMYSLGGILADDMGLGKTLQIISLLLSEINISDINKKPSIVVCPTSLVYNWKSEINKFAPDITTLIISGVATQRSEIISNINNYELIFTSYDLLKRDIELYQDIEFKYCIIDEAQYIKNSTTQNAKAVKLIKSDVRFALTGTPIENSLADLWSIFDFIIPGFLLSYNKFKDKYEIPIVKFEDKEMLSRLHKQIKPFILRRLKKDVLKELPDKIETVSYAHMETVQRKLYTAELLKLQEEFNNEISERGFEKSQIKILAMLTRLRQICCHPSLCFENYKGGSAKLDLCMEIITNSIETNHKVLVFSQFTSMLKIIEQNLQTMSIDYYKLTGSTKSEERLELANNFNSNNVPIFLISLKAGGTGLNLTGADVVIHFDPWWNISAQNQATDRTHRIGQDNKVQVFKLIANDTIEEKIEKLQQNKKDLAESVIQKGEVIINTLSKDEINSLFRI